MDAHPRGYNTIHWFGGQVDTDKKEKMSFGGIAPF